MKKEIRHVVTSIGDAVKLAELEEGDFFVEPWRADYNNSSIDYHVREKIDNFYAKTLLGTTIEVYPTMLVCPVEIYGKTPIQREADW